MDKKPYQALLKCRRASELSSMSQDIRISTWATICLHTHLIICGNCRRFHKGNIAMKRAIALRPQDKNKAILTEK